MWTSAIDRGTRFVTVLPHPSGLETLYPLQGLSPSQSSLDQPNPYLNRSVANQLRSYIQNTWYLALFLSSVAEQVLQGQIWLSLHLRHLPFSACTNGQFIFKDGTTPLSSLH